MRTSTCGCVVAFVVFTIAGHAQQPSPREQQPATAVIEGRVVIGSGIDARPVRHARVELSGGGLASHRITETDARGAFGFVARLTANSKLRIQKPGFVTFEGAPAETITLVRGAAIEGTVINTNGDPLEYARITVVRTDDARMPGVDRQIRTDDLGRYRAHSLPAGDYLVLAESAPSPPQLIGETAGVPATAFYPAATRRKDAQAVHLDAGAEARGIDITGIDGREWQNPAFLERLRRIATSFTLSEGEAKTISLTLRKRP